MIRVELKEERGPHIDQGARDALDDFGLVAAQPNDFGAALVCVKEVMG